MKTAVFTIIGTTPLLMHSTKGMSRQGESAQKMSAKKVPSAAEEAENNCYRDEEGDLYVPAIFFRQAAVTAGKGRKFGKNYATTLLKGGLMDPDRRAKLSDPSTGEILHSYGIDERPVVVSKARVLRARPRFESWGADILLDYDEETLNPDMIADVLSVAGVRVGVGDYRPERGGWFGRFRVESYNEVAP